MPIYCYTSEEGRTKEEFFPCGKAPRSLKIRGVRYFRDIGAEMRGVRSCHAGYPYYSEAMGVHPDQVQEEARVLKEAGIPTEIRSDGCLKVESRSHRRRLIRHLRMYDRDAGYGDPTRS